MVLMWLGSFIKAYGWVVVVVMVLAGYYLRRWVKHEGRIKWDGLKLKVPVLGVVLKAIAVGRFARTLGSLTKGGVTILEALGVVRDTLGNELLGREIDDVTEQVKTGTSLAAPLSDSGYFPPLLVQIVSVGEQTGRLDELLLNAADTFDAEADAATVFPAVLVLMVALVIGFIVAAILLPIVMMSLSAGMF
jgi:type II secretory pathway component PulF